MNYILPKSSIGWDKVKSNQGGATDHKFLMKLHKITVFEVCVTSWIQRYFENYRFVVWPHISSQANNKHKHHHHQNIHLLINMRLAVLTYYDRNYVVDTSLASSAKISFYILMLSIFQSSISYITKMSLNFAGYKSSSIYSFKAKENVIQ